MTKPKHTPGPWDIRGYQVWGPVDPRSKHAGGRVLIGGVVDDLNDWRASPSESIDDRSAFRAETEANIRLFGAAPKMLAALELVANSGLFKCVDEGAWFSIAAAIAEAKGVDS